MRIFAFLMTMALNASAIAFELGEARVISTEPQFKTAIPVLNLTENNQSTLGGHVRSFSDYSDTLQFSVDRAADGALQFILTSRQPLTATLALEVEITYGDLQANREYLLEPLGKTLAAAQPTSTPDKNSSKRIERVRTFDLSLTHTTHIVKPNQSLYDIAVDCKEIGGTVYQRALAIFAANKTAFTQGNINRLDDGLQLYIPQQSYVDNFEPTKSRQMFMALANGKMDIDVAPPTGELAIAQPPVIQSQPSKSVLTESTDIPALGASAESVDYLRNRVQDLETQVSQISQESQTLNEKVDAMAQQLKLLLDKSL